MLHFFGQKNVSCTAKNPQVDSSLLQVCNRFENSVYFIVNYLETNR